MKKSEISMYLWDIHLDSGSYLLTISACNRSTAFSLARLKYSRRDVHVRLSPNNGWTSLSYPSFSDPLWE